MDILHDISVQGDFLPVSDSSLTTTASAAAVDATALLVKHITDVWISGDNRLDMGDKADYLGSIERSSSPPTGEPKKWFFWNDSIYVYDYLPDDEYTLRVEYYKYHDADIEDIEYPDRFRNMIVAGVLSKLWDGVLDAAVEDKQYALAQLQKHHAMYVNELDKHRMNIPTEVVQIKYRDGF